LEAVLTDDSEVAVAVSTKATIRHIELVWPGKTDQVIPRQETDGRWVLEASPDYRRLFPLVELRPYPADSGSALSLVVSGDRTDALRALARGFPQGVRLAYLDVPRIEVDDQTTAFRGDPIYAYSTWLSVLRAHLLAIEPLVSRNGVVVIHTGDIEEPYARLVAEEIFARENRVATIVWQRGYGPRNMKGMKEFTATHDCLLVYAVDKSTLPPVGLRSVPAGFSNPDDDPRGPWKAEHKGAHSRRAKSDFNTYVPPYRWRIVEGTLPRGLWRLNPLTGVIWGTATEAGEFPITIEVTDSAGNSATRKLILASKTAGEPSPFPQIPWLFEEIKTSGRLRVSTRRLPDAVMNCEYSAICLAEGGVPHTAPPKRPGSGRYWEFADDTLVRAYQRDDVHLGRDGSAIPHPKTHREGVGDNVVVNQMTWWPGRERGGTESATFAGYTEDATKHLKKLQAAGLLSRIVTTGKPEHLLARLIDIFTDPQDVVLELFGEAADLSAVAIKRGRRFLYLSGTSDRQRELLEGCALPRLRAVVDGKDRELETHQDEIRMRADAYLPYEGGGSFITCAVGSWLFERRLREDLPRLATGYSRFEELRSALLTSQGFFPRADETGPDGFSMIGNGVAVVLPPDEYLDRETVADIVAKFAPSYERVTVFYFRSAEDFDQTTLVDGVICRRVPNEVTI
jgi:hypothetical protein